MQDENNVVSPADDPQYAEFKRRQRMQEAKASISKIECDCLSPFTDKAVLRETCKNANALALGAMVVFPAYVKSCVSFLGSDPQVSLIASVGYPYGAEVTEVKVNAVKRAVRDGVDEVEVCAPTAFLRDGNYSYFKKECKKLKRASKLRALRITFNCSYLDEKELIKACQVAADAGANCVRLTETTGEIVKKVKDALKGKCLIKADRADNPTTFAAFCVMGADYVTCTSACEVASFLLSQV